MIKKDLTTYFHCILLTFFALHALVVNGDLLMVKKQKMS